MLGLACTRDLLSQTLSTTYGRGHWGLDTYASSVACLRLQKLGDCQEPNGSQSADSGSVAQATLGSVEQSAVLTVIFPGTPHKMQLSSNFLVNVYTAQFNNVY